VLLASLDAARETMQKKGRKKLEHMLIIAQRLCKEINRIADFEVVSNDYHKQNHVSVYERDLTKVLVDVTRSGLNGFEVANILESKYNIVVEAYNLKTILLLVPFRATMFDVQATADALRNIQKKNKKTLDESAQDIKIPTSIPRILELNEVSKLLLTQIEKVPLVDAIDRIAAEHITPFPPGIPMTIKGEALTQEIVEYYVRLKSYKNVHIAARDKSMEYVWVVK